MRPVKNSGSGSSTPSDSGTREPQYERCLDLDRDGPRTSLGLMSNQIWRDDPRRLGFVLARYKFVSKMFSGFERVMEVGCADAFGTSVVLQEVGSVTACDFDPLFVEDAKRHVLDRPGFECRVHDMLAGPLEGKFDGAYAVDVIEHIAPEDELRFVGNMVASLTDTGVLILGSPSLESQRYASPLSKAGHINCKDADGLRALLSHFFSNVFIFSMNDEVVHTGFTPMAHYLFGLACTRK